MKQNREMVVRCKKFADINNMLNLKDDFHIIAGPCAVESYEQMDLIAEVLKKSGLSILRGGVFKPRTSPYEFQGLGEEGARILHSVAKKYNMLIVSEILDVRDIEIGMKYFDVLQIGSRNMHNTALLKEVGKVQKPVLLKRGFMSSIKEFLLASEYIISSGNENLIMCERGIRTFETYTRNTLDLSCAAIIKQETSLPVIVDLSHSLGRKDIMLPIAKAVKGLGSDGIMLEVHNDPLSALSDKSQQLDLMEFGNLVKQLRCRRT